MVALATLKCSERDIPHNRTPKRQNLIKAYHAPVELTATGASFLDISKTLQNDDNKLLS